MHRAAIVGILLAAATLCLAQTEPPPPVGPVQTFLSASGTGCPSVDRVIPDIRELYQGSLKIEYRDFAPQATPQDLTRHAVQDCRVVLDLDLRDAAIGYQFSFASIGHQAWAHFDQAEWYQDLDTAIYFNSTDSPKTSVHIL